MSGVYPPRSPWIVTTRRKVHRRDSGCVERIAFASSWLPSVSKPTDHACRKCLHGLPDATDEAALTTPADPTTEETHDG